MDDEDIEIASKWEGEPGQFVKELVAIRLLDVVEGDAYSLHDWEEHNPWASKSEDRSDSARLSRLARKNPETASELKKQGRTGITAEEYRQYESCTNRSTTVQRPNNESCTNRSTTVQRPNNESCTNRSTPAPAPAPTPNVIEDRDDKSSLVGQDSPTQLADEVLPPEKKPEQIPYQKIISHLNAKCGCGFKDKSGATRRHIKARWNEGHRLNDFVDVIDSKHEEWSTDAKMCAFLRPETLFGSKFDSYLQVARASPVQTSANDEELAQKRRDELTRKILAKKAAEGAQPHA
jgi:uncharacterized phage protein (TIGR02220 family)